MEKQNQKETSTVVEKKRQFCTFWLAGRLFGVDILDVKEINAGLEFTPIFHAPESVKGYVNIRGQIHLVIDLRLLMSYQNEKLNEKMRVILFKPSVGEPFGVLVDQISDVVEIDEKRIEDIQNAKQEGIDNLDSEKSGLAVGVSQLEKNLLVVLEAKRFLKAIRFPVNQETQNS